ncbi:MAG: electron transporter [Spirulina sp. SIO3F2]|nr:electron transporter [Spirulina sp. SIO3F2]
MFASLIVLLRNAIGQSRFNRTRGQVIGLHCKTITNFCNFVGIESKERQSLIRLARNNGKRLGLMA